MCNERPDIWDNEGTFNDRFLAFRNRFGLELRFGSFKSLGGGGSGSGTGGCGGEMALGFGEEEDLLVLVVLELATRLAESEEGPPLQTRAAAAEQ